MHPLLLAANVVLWLAVLAYGLRLAAPLARRWKPGLAAAAVVLAIGFSLGSYFLSQRPPPRQQQFEKHYHAGLDEVARGNLTEAEKQFEAALAVNPDDAEARRRLDEVRRLETAPRREQTRETRVDPGAVPASGGGSPGESAPPAANQPGNAPALPAVGNRPGEAPQPAPHRPSPFEITHYALDVKLQPAEHRLEAEATIQVRSRGGAVPVLDFSLNPECRPHRVRWNGETASFRHTNDNLEVTPSRPLPAGGAATVQVSYRREGPAQFKSSGDLISEEGTFFRSETRWYPATGELDFRSPVRVRATVPRGYSVVSVGGLRGITKANDEATFHWETDRLASMVSLAAGRYAQRSLMLEARAESAASRPPLKITCYTYPAHSDRAPEFLRQAAAIVRYYEKLFGPYPYEKLAIVEIPLFPGGYGTTSFIMLLDESFTWPKVDREFVAHEIAHQWWGNSVFPQGLGAAWLTEAFANYSAWLYDAAIAGNPRVLRKRVERACRSYFREAARQGDQAIYETDPYRSAGAWQEILYEKGAVILHMLRLEVGDAQFFRILRTHADRYRFGRAKIEDFRRVAEEVHGRPLGWFFDQWLGRTGGMELEYRFETVPESPTQNQAVLTVRQLGQSYRARLPVRLDVENQEHLHILTLDGTPEQVFRIPVRGKLTNVAVDPDRTLLLKRARWTPESGSP